jgi:hypothetical protein
VLKIITSADDLQPKEGAAYGPAGTVPEGDSE